MFVVLLLGVAFLLFVLIWPARFMRAHWFFGSRWRYRNSPEPSDTALHVSKVALTALVLFVGGLAVGWLGAAAPKGKATPASVTAGFVALAGLVLAAALYVAWDQWRHKGDADRPDEATVNRSVDRLRIGALVIIAVALVVGWLVVAGRSTAIEPLPGADRVERAEAVTDLTQVGRYTTVSDVRIDPVDNDTIRVNYLADEDPECGRHVRFDVGETADAVTATVVVGDLVSAAQAPVGGVDRCDLSPGLVIGDRIHRYEEIDLASPLGTRPLLISTVLPSDLVATG